MALLPPFKKFDTFVGIHTYSCMKKKLTDAALNAATDAASDDMTDVALNAATAKVLDAAMNAVPYAHLKKLGGEFDERSKRFGACNSSFFEE